jgi:hypothetical protein
MKATVHICILGLLVLFTSASGALCNDFTDPGFGDINVSDNDFEDGDKPWEDLSKTDINPSAVTTVTRVNAGEGMVTTDSMVALLNELEQKLLNKESLDGEIEIDGKTVSLSEEVSRQQKVWEEAGKRFLVSAHPENGLGTMTDTDFVDTVDLNSQHFEALFASVIDSDKLAEQQESDDHLKAADYVKVANLYRALNDDLFSLKSSRFLASNASDFEVASKAKTSADIIETRMKNYVDTLKRVLIKG